LPTALTQDKMAGKDCTNLYKLTWRTYKNEAHWSTITNYQIPSCRNTNEFLGSLTPTMFTPGDRALALWAELPGYSGTSVRAQIKL
jgi:hypothetical protein